jgi:hypothetical protein
MNEDMKVKLHNRLKECGIGFLLSGAYIILKYFYWPDIFVWIAEIVFVIFCMAIFFIRGYRRGDSITSFKQELKEMNSRGFFVSQFNRLRV